MSSYCQSIPDKQVADNLDFVPKAADKLGQVVGVHIDYIDTVPNCILEQCNRLEDTSELVVPAIQVSSVKTDTQSGILWETGAGYPWNHPCMVSEGSLIAPHTTSSMNPTSYQHYVGIEKDTQIIGIERRKGVSRQEEPIEPKGTMATH